MQEDANVPKHACKGVTARPHPLGANQQRYDSNLLMDGWHNVFRLEQIVRVLGVQQVLQERRLVDDDAARAPERQRLSEQGLEEFRIAAFLSLAHATGKVAENFVISLN